MTNKVKDFSGFMKSRLNESEEMEGMAAGMSYGANPEEEEMEMEEFEEVEGDEAEGEEEEEVTLEDLKAMVEDLTERIEALEGGDEEEEEVEDEDAEGEEEEEVEEEEEA